MNKVLGILLIAVGIGLLGYSFSLEGFTDREEFDRKVSKLIKLEDRSERFRQLRASYLTPKYALENYGLVAIILGVCIMVVFPENSLRFKTPKRKYVIALVGFLAVMLTVGGYIGDLFLEMQR